MEGYIILKPRQGRSQEFFKLIALNLSEGGSHIPACKEGTDKTYIRTLKELHGIDVKATPVYSTSPMKLIYDLNDPNRWEPAIIGIDYGTKRFSGYKLELIK